LSFGSSAPQNVLPFILRPHSPRFAHVRAIPASFSFLESGRSISCSGSACTPKSVSCSRT
jgi:hypothetical protein